MKLPTLPFPSPRRQRAFTLVELMVTVAIVAILAAVAAASMSKHGKKVRANNAATFLGAVQAAQAGFGTPLGQSGTDFCPASIGSSPTTWDATCESTFWLTLGVVPPPQTFYQYAVIAGGPTDTCANFSGIATTCDQIRPNPAGVNWWVAIARGDLDGDGEFSTFITSSMANGAIYKENELE